MDGFTTFVFLHIFQGLFLLWLAWKNYQLEKGMKTLGVQILDHAANTSAAIISLAEAVRQRDQHSPAALLLQGLQGAVPGLSVEQVSDQDPAEEQFPSENPIDPDEDDDITTLGEVLS